MPNERVSQQEVSVASTNRLFKKLTTKRQRNGCQAVAIRGL